MTTFNNICKIVSKHAKTSQQSALDCKTKNGFTTIAKGILFVYYTYDVINTKGKAKHEANEYNTTKQHQ